MKRVVFLLVFIAGCSEHYWRLKAEEPRFEREYDWEKPGAYSPTNHIFVQHPKWAVTPNDQAEIRKAVDHTVNVLRGRPDCSNFDFGRVILWIHENPGRYVSPQGNLVTGQRIGNRITVSIIEVADGWVLHSLAHELLHVVFDTVYGDKSHVRFDSEDVKALINKARVVFTLSSGAVESARAYQYSPWRTD